MVRASDDLLLYRLMNVTGKTVVLIDPMGAERQRIPSAGDVTFQDRSIPLLNQIEGLPTFQFRLVASGGLPPPHPRFHPKHYPAYVLVNHFTAAMLAGTGVRRPDILVVVNYTNADEDTIVARGLAHVPLR